MNDQTTPPAAPEPTDSDSRFLDMVRQSNESRHTDSGDPQEPQQTPPQEGDPPDGQEKEPQEEKKEEGDKQPAGGEQEDNESGVLTDPLAAAPRKNTKTENLKNLRNSLRAEKDRSAALEEERNQLRQQVDSKELPEETKTKLAEYETRLEKLDRYEKLLGLYQTEGYKETYYDAETQIVEKTTSIANDYGISEDDLKPLFEITNRKELMERLQDHFDLHTAGEVRKLILDRQELLKKREAADQDPEKARQELISMVGERQKELKKRAYTELSNLVQGGWELMLSKYSDPKTGLEILTEIPGDKEHTDQRQALLQRAEGELGKFMSAFVQAGLTHMSPEMAQALAARFQLSEATAILHAENKALQKRLEDLESVNSKLTKHSRPLNNGRAPSGRTSAPAQDDVSRDQIASHVMSKALEQTAEK